MRVVAVANLLQVSGPLYHHWNKLRCIQKQEFWTPRYNYCSIYGKVQIDAIFIFIINPQ